MSQENKPMQPTLDQAISEIRDQQLPDYVVDAAAACVWNRLSHEHIADCAAFRALFSDFRAGRLPEARAMLVRDHLHECVACRRAFEGKVATMPAPAVPQAVPQRPVRWAAVAAGVVAAGGLAVWFTVLQTGGTGRAIVQSISGTLYEVSPTGLRVMKAGEPLPEGVEVRTARGSNAVLTLRDGSRVETGERCDLSTAYSGVDATIHLDRGSVVVQAAKRSSGHLYLATADCRVAVTGTVFGVSAGVKGSRVSVVEGEVQVNRDTQQTVLHPGDQLSTSDTIEPLPVRDEVSWDHDAKLMRQLAALRMGLSRVPMPQIRYSSRLLGVLPASTVFYASIPNLSGYLAAAGDLFRRKAAENGELRAWLAGPGAAIEPVLDKLRTANEYLGDEIVVFGSSASSAPVFLAEMKRPGLEEFLKGAGLPIAMTVRSGKVLLSPDPKALSVPLDSSFQKTEFYKRIGEAYQQGAGLLFCADLRYPLHPPGTPEPPALAGIAGRYLVAGQKEIGSHLETRASLSLDAPNSGFGHWLASPSPMGALDYITPDATLLGAFALKDPPAALDQLAGLISLPAGRELRTELGKSLGGELAVALDGPPLPVPSWKIVAELYDPQRFETALERWAATYNRQAPPGARQLHLANEVVDGRTFYSLTWGDASPLSQAQYTFASGYLVAAPTRALVLRALQAKTNGQSIVRSPAFTALIPHDPYPNFSAIVYQNVGTTLAPFAGLLDRKSAAAITDLKPVLIAAYGEPDRITLASTGDLLGMSFNNMLSGSLFGIAQNALPLAQLLGTTASPNSYR